MNNKIDDRETVFFKISSISVKRLRPKKYVRLKGKNTIKNKLRLTYRLLVGLKKLIIIIAILLTDTPIKGKRNFFCLLLKIILRFETKKKMSEMNI